MPSESILPLLRWAVPVCFGLHVIEELFWPGGFMEWYHRYRPQLAAEPRSYYYRANALYFAATLLVPFARQSTAPYVLLFTTGILFNNLVFTHILGAIKTRERSPGIVTGILLYVPLVAMSYGYVLSHGLVGLSAALICLMLSSAGEIYFATKKI